MGGACEREKEKKVLSWKKSDIIGVSEQQQQQQNNPKWNFCKIFKEQGGGGGAVRAGVCERTWKGDGWGGGGAERDCWGV